MKVLKKWNNQKRIYEKYEIPEDWIVSCYENDMGATVNCCQCGKKMLFGDGYASKEVQTELGFGYCVCEKCYEKEKL